MEYKTIDLCAGIGGIRKGFELTNQFKNILASEIDAHACATYEHLYGESPKNDLTSEEFKQLVTETEYDVLLAGFPCQAFSRCGLRQGFRDTTKGTIFFDIADIISRTNPKAIFLENVENLMSHDKGRTIRIILEALENELEYHVIGVSYDVNNNLMYSRKSFIRNSKYFGLPQNRPRVYIMAFSKKEFGNAINILGDELPNHSSEIIAEDVTQILDKEVDDSYYMASQYWETLKKHKAREKARGHGFGYAIINKPGIEHPVANTLLATGGSGKERNLVYQPKEGVAGKIIPSKRSPLNDEGIRIMTPIEWGRLQGFIDYAFIDEYGIDQFSFPEGTAKTQQYKQFGNSVTIPVIREMANFMLKSFDDMDDFQEKHILELISSNYGMKVEMIEKELNISAHRASYLLGKLLESSKIKIDYRGHEVFYMMDIG